MARFYKRILIVGACLFLICIVSYKQRDIFKIITQNPEDELRRLRHVLSNWRGHVMNTLNMSEMVHDLKHLPQNISLNTWHNWDIMKLPKKEFLPNYKNPCWMEKYWSKPEITCRTVKVALKDYIPRDEQGVEKLRCLPYFFLIGQPKCGTTDISARLKKHPDVRVSGKDLLWFERNRFVSQCSSINNYLDVHLLNSRVVQNYTLPETDYHPKIIGDSSADIMWDNTIWPLLPGNQGCQEPCVTNPDMIHHLNPKTRIIITLRNPVDRLFSDYLFESNSFGYRLSKEDFHKEVVREIALFTDCLKTSTLRGCVYNGTLENTFKSHIRLLIGLYSVHLSDWLRVFPRKQVHVVHFESYAHDLENNMESIFKFLDLRKLNSQEMKVVTGVDIMNKRKRGLEIGSMLNETKELLTEFYKPFNRHLVQILSDERFSWDS